MPSRTLYARTCPCGQRFTTGDADSVYHSKACGAKHRAARDGMPVPHTGASVDKLKGFHMPDSTRAPR
jgi:hypothetical protein